MNKEIDDAVFAIAIGAVIKDLREEKGWSQLELAEKIGLKDRAHVSRIERGKVDFLLSTLRRIAAAFGLEADDLFMKGYDRATQQVD